MAMFVWDSWAVHVVFVAPPASHYAPMLPIAHGLLDDGHQVSFVGFNETAPWPKLRTDQAMTA